MKQRGKRIRPSGKDLVFHFTIASLLPVFLLVVGLFHVKTIQQINWQDFNLSQADKIDIPYLIISFSVAILICLLVAFVFKRVRYDTVKQLYHRQKLAKMILENKWYESEQVKTEGFFKDSAGRTKEKIGEVPASLQNYIDYQAYGRDLDLSGTFISTNHGIFEIVY